MNQPVTKYNVIRGNTPEHLADLVNAALPNAQPFGAPIVDRMSGTYCQAVIEQGGAYIYDGQELAIEPTGVYTESVTLTVEGGVVTAITLA